MPDRGHELTDELLSKLERRIAREYRAANKEAAAKLQAYLEEDEAKRKVQESLLKAGKITQKDYNNWVFRHKMMGKRWEEMRDVLAQDYHNANQIALNIAKGRMPDVYALNCNFATYQIEHDAEIDTGFTLYNHDTAEYLLEDERTLMPGPSTHKQREIAQNKDMQWNRNKIQSAVLQGILQGESPYDVAKRLQNVGQMNYNAAVRYARTMTTNAQNAGRYQAFRRADQIGVDLTIEWQATLDGRTRHEHRMMHGQRRNVGEPFEIEGVKILWPAQVNYDGTNLPQELIWNCRCTLLSWVKGFEGDTVKTSPKMGDMSFEEWQEAKPRRESSDREQYQRYKETLKSKAPKTFAEFEDIKYENPEKWDDLKEKYRIKRANKRGSPFTSEEKGSIIKAEDIAKQSRIPKPEEDASVVSWVKPIVGKHSRTQDVKAVNPNFLKSGAYEWHYNCQRCVTTYEARRRGFDVTALPRYYEDDIFAAGSGFTLPYQKGDRRANPLWYEAGLTITDSKNFTSQQCRDMVETLMRDYGNGSRAILDGWFYPPSNQGHVFFVENIDGKILFVDPQSGNMDCSDYFERMSPRAMRIFRVDDLPFNDNIKDVFRNDVE